MRVDRSRQKGLSLVELLVAMAVTLVLVSIASYAYLNTKTLYNVTDEQSIIYEEGRFALDFLGQNIRLAGFIPAVDSPDRIRYFDDVVKVASSVPGLIPQAIKGCEGNYDSATGDCGSGGTIVPGSDALIVTYFTDAPNVTRGIGVDCIGHDAQPVTVPKLPSGTTTLYVVTNRFYLSTRSYTLGGVARTLNEVSCMGIGDVASGSNPVPQPFLKGVKDMKLSFGLSSANAEQRVDRYYKASAVQTANAWDQVVSVQLCVLMETEKGGKSVASGNYVDCDGNSQTAPNGYIRKSFSAIYNLRNRVSR